MGDSSPADLPLFWCQRTAHTCLVWKLQVSICNNDWTLQFRRRKLSAFHTSSWNNWFTYFRFSFFCISFERNLANVNFAPFYEEMIYAGIKQITKFKLALLPFGPSDPDPTTQSEGWTGCSDTTHVESSASLPFNIVIPPSNINYNKSSKVQSSFDLSSCHSHCHLWPRRRRQINCE